MISISQIKFHSHMNEIGSWCDNNDEIYRYARRRHKVYDKDGWLVDIYFTYDFEFDNKENEILFALTFS